MKKRYRIGICSVLTVCLLLLSACTGGQTPHTDDPAQSTGQNNQSNTQGNTVDIISQEENKLPVFHWTNSFYRFHTNKVIPAFEGIKKYTHEEIQQVTDQLSDGHACSMDCRAYSDGVQICLHQKAVESLSFPKEYFDNHTLFSVELPCPGKTRTCEVTDVRYEGEILKIYIAKLYTEGVKADSEGGNVQCFIELDAAIPDGTRVKVEFTEQWLDNEAFQKKADSFTEKVIYLYQRDLKT